MRRNCKRKGQWISGLLAGVMAVALMAGVPVNVAHAETTMPKNPRVNANGGATWDCVYFGNYPQSDATGNTKEPIKWRVLSVDGNDAFLVADANLDVQQYNQENVSVTWETCTLRSWLNSTFMNAAFTSAEQEAILTTTVVNNDGTAYGGGNNTVDKVFLLSYNEVTTSKYGFSSNASASDEARIRKNTAYTAKQGAIFAGDYPDRWWLRSLGIVINNVSNAAGVDETGSVNRAGVSITADYYAVCPALHLDLSTSDWTYAGTVGSSECSHKNTVTVGLKEATCTETGYTGDIYCTDCGINLKTGENIPAKGHQWNGGTITKAATDKEQGSMTFTCTVCGETKTETIEATGGDQVVIAGFVVTDEKTKAAYKILTVGSNGTVEYVKSTDSKISTVSVPASITINGSSYKVTSIASKAFKDNKSLTKVVIGSNVKTIGTGAFRGCSKLKTVTIGKNVTTIGDNAFYNCKKLNKITIPAKVNKIGKKAFYGCKNLKSITIKTTKLSSKKVGSKAFKGIYAKATIKVPKSKLAAYKKLLKAKGVGSKAKIKK